MKEPSRKTFFSGIFKDQDVLSSLQSAHKHTQVVL